MRPFLEQWLDLSQQCQAAQYDLTHCLDSFGKAGAIPRTVEVCTDMMTALDELGLGVHACACRNDLTGAKIIYRAFLEQYLRLVYLLVRQFHRPDDALTTRYTDALVLAELLNCRRAEWWALNTNRTLHFSPASTWNGLVTDYPQFRLYNWPAAEALLEEFSWEAITRYLQDARVQNGKSHIAELIYDHASSVSYVQGGFCPDAQLPDDLRESELVRLCFSLMELTLDAKYLCCHFGEPHFEGFKAIEKRLCAIAGNLPDITINSHFASGS